MVGLAAGLACLLWVRGPLPAAQRQVEARAESSRQEGRTGDAAHTVTLTP